MSGFCPATLLRRDLDVEQVGAIAALLEDATPLQLGVKGRRRGMHFAVVGRLQVRLAAGRLERVVLRVSSTAGPGGWADAAGEYTVSFEATMPETAPRSGGPAPGMQVALGGVALRGDRGHARGEVVDGEGGCRSGWTPAGKIDERGPAHPHRAASPRWTTARSTPRL